MKKRKTEPIQKMTVSVVQLLCQNIKNYFLLLRRGLKFKSVNE